MSGSFFSPRGNDFLFLKNKRLFPFRVNIFLPCQLLHINRCYNRKPSERTTSASCFKTAQFSQLSFTPAPTNPRVISSRRRSLIPVKVCCRPSSIVCLYLALSRQAEQTTTQLWSGLRPAQDQPWSELPLLGCRQAHQGLIQLRSPNRPRSVHMINTLFDLH